MLDMPKKSGATASAVREAARAGSDELATTQTRPKRRTFRPEYKLRILREADAALASGIERAFGELLRREGLYSSHIVNWRKMRAAGELEVMTKKRGPVPRKNPLTDEVARLERENARLQKELHKATTIIDVQKKVASLLGETLATPTEEDFLRAAASSGRKRR
jgi:transposase-like protein